MPGLLLFPPVKILWGVCIATNMNLMAFQVCYSSHFQRLKAHMTQGTQKFLGRQSQLCHHSYLHSWWQHGVVHRTRSDLTTTTHLPGRESKHKGVPCTAIDTSSVSSLPELDLGLCGPSTSFVVWPSAAFPFSWNGADTDYIISAVSLKQ